MQICNFVAGNQHANSKQTTFKQHQVSHLINKNHMNLSSLEYVRLIAWIAAFKHRVILNKTQMQKLLFMCYGQALVMNGQPLFEDDTPKAWPFGPVFPRSYKKYEEIAPTDLSDAEKSRYAENLDILRMIAKTVATYCHISATRLSDWSHEKDGPWWKTVFREEGSAWNREIPQDIIREYFQSDKWSVGI